MTRSIKKSKKLLKNKSNRKNMLIKLYHNASYVLTNLLFTFNKCTP